jgi:hypothetical protein
VNAVTAPDDPASGRRSGNFAAERTLPHGDSRFGCDLSRPRTQRPNLFLQEKTMIGRLLKNLEDMFLQARAGEVGRM